MAKKKKRKKAKVINLQPKMSLQKYIKLNARKLAIHEAYMVDNLFNMGKGNVVFVRKKQNGQKLVGVYLVDTWCLGVKDTFYKLFEDFEYADFRDKYFTQSEFNVSVCDANHACNVIYGALEYAEDLGIDPHPHFDVSEHILIDVEEVDYEELEFGYEGKPHYMPHDNDNRGAILSKLNASVGKDGYYYTDGDFFIDDEGDNNNDVPFTFEEAADYYLDDMEEKSSYYSYVTIVMLLDKICMTDIDHYKQIFIKDNNEFLKEVYKGEFSNIKEQIATPEIDLDGLILAVAENYFIYGGTEFVLREEYVKVFAKEIEDDLVGLICKVYIMEYGQKKLTSLISFASKILDTQGYEDFGIDAVKDFYQNPTHLFDENDDNQELDIVFDYIEEYEDLYGDIDFDSVTLNL